MSLELKILLQISLGLYFAFKSADIVIPCSLIRLSETSSSSYTVLRPFFHANMGETGLLMAPFHLNLSCTKIGWIPFLARSLETTWSQVICGQPLPWLPSTTICLDLLTQLLSSILSTWPNQLNWVYVSVRKLLYFRDHIVLYLHDENVK